MYAVDVNNEDNEGSQLNIFHKCMYICLGLFNFSSN